MVLLGHIETRKRKHYTLEEKKEAVRLRRELGITFDEIEQRTGIPSSSVRRYNHVADVANIAKIRYTSCCLLVSSLVVTCMLCS